MKVDDVIRFSYNWNNKLDSNQFTTIRRYNQRKYVVGAVHSVFLKVKKEWVECKNKAKIRDVKCLKLSQIVSNPWICGLDTGYSEKETEVILRRMHKGVTEDSLFSYVLYQYIKDEKEQ